MISIPDKHYQENAIKVLSGMLILEEKYQYEPILGGNKQAPKN
jgi:hypothetical protein